MQTARGRLGMYLTTVTLICLALAGLTLARGEEVLHKDDTGRPERTCEPLRVQMCKNSVDYRQTGFPNLANHSSQHDSVEVLDSYKSLIQSECSTDLPFLLCSVYVPFCSPHLKTVLGPCRPICLDVRRKCAPVVKNFKMPWPTILDCQRFPMCNTPSHPCMDPRPPQGVCDTPPPGQKPSQPRMKPGGFSTTTKIPAKTATVILSSRPSTYGPSREDPNGYGLIYNAKGKPVPVVKPLCSSKRHPKSYKFMNASGKCLPKCNVKDAFSGEDTYLIDIWMGVWASICFLCTSVILITFLLDTSRVRFPERPVIFVTLSSNLHSIGYLVRLAVGKSDIACDSTKSVLVQEDLDNANCTVVFLLLYFFGMAAVGWWALFCISWFIHVYSKKSPEGISAYSSYFHLAAWGIPAILSISIIVLRDVSGEELTGLCFVGEVNTVGLLAFVVGPLSVFLAIGLLALLVGYVKLVYERKALSKADKTHSATLRTLSFAILFSIPTFCIIACYCYEYRNRFSWYNITEDRSTQDQPTVAVFMLKIFSWLLIGILCSLSLLCDKSATEVWVNCGKGKQTKGKLKSSQVQRHYIPVNNCPPNHTIFRGHLCSDKTCLNSAAPVGFDV